ncbi:MAG TPA: ROK family transcriptional regulator [Solirubrobacteraceae bacterium]|jgi:predicted NBD/HSP70 family sugar kinase
MVDRNGSDGFAGLGYGDQDSRLSLLREVGEQAVLEVIFREGPITRPAISAATTLSKPTVGAAVSRLEQAGMIRAVGPQHGRRGRSPIAYVVRDNAGFVVGVDIGGTNVRAGAADIFGEPIHDEQEPTSKRGGRAVATQLIEVATRSVERARATHERLLAVGISTPGVVDRESGRVRLAYNVSPDGVLDLLSAIGNRFGVPVLIDNNVNLAALGEKSFGLARGVSTMVFIGVGAGIGMGIIMDDELVRGAHGGAGEIGYLPLVGDPFDPRHKLHGGLEDEVGAAGVLAAYKSRAAKRKQPAASAQDVFELARDGQPEAAAVVEHVAARLGAAIATVCAILDPELVVLGGGIGSSPLLLSPVRGAAAALVPMTARIETSLLGDRAALQGAIAVALHAARAELIPQRGGGARKNAAALRELSR